MTAREIALRHGACPHPVCTNARRTTFHFGDRCPEGASVRPTPLAVAS